MIQPRIWSELGKKHYQGDKIERHYQVGVGRQRIQYQGRYCARVAT
jgi:hypothetical protein